MRKWNSFFFLNARNWEIEEKENMLQNCFCQGKNQIFNEKLTNDELASGEHQTKMDYDISEIQGNNVELQIMFFTGTCSFIDEKNILSKNKGFVGLATMNDDLKLMNQLESFLNGGK